METISEKIKRGLGVRLGYQYSGGVISLESNNFQMFISNFFLLLSLLFILFLGNLSVVVLH